MHQPPSDDLEAENRRLAARIADLEAQLEHAALDRPSLYRMTDAAPWGALVVNLDHRIDYANPAFQRWLAAPAPATGALAETIVAPALMAVLRAPIATALAGRPTILEHDLLGPDGETRSLKLQVAPRGAGPLGVTGAVVSLYDLTDVLALDRTARTNEAQLERINAVIPSVIYIYDLDAGLPVWIGGRTGSILGYGDGDVAAAAASGQKIANIVHPDDLPALARRLAELARLPDGEVIELEFRARRRDGGYRWVLDRSAVFERDPSGRVTKTLSAAIDVDERKRADERRILLINELNHRVKNTIATIQSIARQTLRGGGDPTALAEVFTARLVALSDAHDVLTRENWEGAGLRDIVQVALAPFGGAGRVSAQGPDLRLGPRAALALGMALHELATNATKYGALSVDCGQVDIAWRARREGPTATLDLTWREHGGPPVTPPRRRGFGSRLLTQGVRNDLGGATQLEFLPEGLVCRITAPVEAAPVLDLD